jgi:hypothetical protein
LSFWSRISGRKETAVVSGPALSTAPVEKIAFEDVALGMIRRDSSSVSQGVPAFWFARALEPGNMASMWRPFAQSVWVQRAVKIISGPISAVKPDFYPRASAKGQKGRQRQKCYRAPKPIFRDPDSAIDLPQLEQFLKQPARGLSYADFIEATIGWLKMEEAFWLLADTTLVPFKDAKTYKPQPVIVAQPYRMRHVVENGELVGWTYVDLSGKSWTLLPEQVIQIKGWNPYDNWRGLGEYASASVAAEGDWLAGKFSRNLMGNNGDTGPFIVAKNGLPTDPQRQQIIDALREKRHAQLRGEFKPIFMTGDIEVQDPKISSVDAPFIQQRIEARHEIYAAFGIPMSMGDIKASYSIGADSDMFWLLNFTCIPTGGKICGALELLAQRLFGLDIEVLLDWEAHPVMQAARRQRLKDADGLFSKGVPMSVVDEYLDLGLPDYEGKDTGYIAINLSPTTGEEAEALQAPLKPDDFSEVPAKPGVDDADQPEPVKEMLRALRGKGQLIIDNGQCRSPKNEKLWQSHMRRRAGIVKLLQAKASKIFNEFRIKALKKLDATYGRKSIQGSTESHPTTKSLIDVIFDKDHFGSALNSALQNPLQAALETSVGDLMVEIGRTDDPWKMPPAAALKFIKQRENKISGVSDTAAAQLKTAWEESVAKGENVDELAARVKVVFNDLGKYEARRIAMTETCALDGFARHEGMVGAGIECKSWLSSHGPNVRPTHEAAEAKYEAHPIPVDDPFIVGGEELMYPGDEAGSAGNVINCQCIQLACAGKKEEGE